MKSIFDKIARDELIGRINTLYENSAAQWGELNIYQMLRHCLPCEEMLLGKKEYKRVFMGSFFDRMTLKNFIKGENPMKRNLPAVPAFRVKENSGNTGYEREKWIALIKEYEHFSSHYSVHTFFGKMTKEKIGHWNDKHIDH